MSNYGKDVVDHLSTLEALKVGEWYYFNPCIYDSGGGLIRIEGVNHNDDVLEFSYRAIETPPEAPATQHIVHRLDIEKNGAIYGMYLRPVYDMELVGFISNAIRNVGDEVYKQLKEQLP
jgi:hypothetical protein